MSTVNTMKIVTNNVPRHIIDAWELSRIIPQGSERHHPMECDAPEFAGWDGYLSDSFFSGLLIKFADDHESVIVGRYTC